MTQVHQTHPSHHGRKTEGGNGSCLFNNYCIVFVIPALTPKLVYKLPGFQKDGAKQKELAELQLFECTTCLQPQGAAKRATQLNIQYEKNCNS